MPIPASPASVSMRPLLVLTLSLLAAPAWAQATNVQQLLQNPASGASVNGAAASIGTAGASERQAEVRVQSVNERSADGNSLARSWSSGPAGPAAAGPAAASGATAAPLAQGAPIVLRGASTAPGEVIRTTATTPVAGEVIRVRAPGARDGS